MAKQRHGSRPSAGGVASRFKDLQNEYRAASAVNSRFVSTSLGSAAIGVGANVHTVNDSRYFKMMELFRHLEINDRLVGVAVRRLVTNVLQQGMTINPTTGDPDSNKLLKEKFREWSTDKTKCDITERLNFHQMAKIVLKRIIVDGDVFCLPQKKTLKLQFAEAHRCRTPTNMKRRIKTAVPIHGVEHNEQTGGVVRFHFTKTDVDLAQTVTRVDQVSPRKASGVLHLMLPDRFTQSRGVSSLARVPTEAGQYDDAIFAKLVATQVQSCFAIIEEIEVGADEGKDAELLAGNDAVTGEWNKSEVEISPGMILPGKAGRKYKAFSPNLNMADFKEFSHMILGTIAVNLDIPLIVLLLDATQTNFSGWRGALDQARLRFKELQQELIDQFYSPIYKWLVERWIKSDPEVAKIVERLGIKAFSHSWNRPQFTYIEPLKDTTADALQLNTAMVSPVEFHGRQGRDWNEFYPEVVDAYGDAIEAACLRTETINERFEFANINWRDVFPLPVAKGLKITVVANEADDEAADDDDAKKSTPTTPASATKEIDEDE
tara:strand:- start:926 stop:2569 length:1644 start_codon:yes stop_codon:yes gene_type:complete